MQVVATSKHEKSSVPLLKKTGECTHLIDHYIVEKFSREGKRQGNILVLFVFGKANVFVTRKITYRIHPSEIASLLRLSSGTGM